MASLAINKASKICLPSTSRFNYLAFNQSIDKKTEIINQAYPIIKQMSKCQLNKQTNGRLHKFYNQSTTEEYSQNLFQHSKLQTPQIKQNMHYPFKDPKKKNVKQRTKTTNKVCWLPVYPSWIHGHRFFGVELIWCSQKKTPLKHPKNKVIYQPKPIVSAHTHWIGKSPDKFLHPEAFLIPETTKSGPVILFCGAWRTLINGQCGLWSAVEKRLRRGVFRQWRIWTENTNPELFFLKTIWLFAGYFNSQWIFHTEKRWDCTLRIFGDEVNKLSSL